MRIDIPKNIPEYFIKLYFEEHHEKYGFKNITRGLFSDYEGVYYGKKVNIEIERNLKEYIRHGLVYTDVVVYLLDVELTEKERQKLPRHIVKIHEKDFYEWFRKQKIIIDTLDDLEYYARASENMRLMGLICELKRNNNRLDNKIMALAGILKTMRRHGLKYTEHFVNHCLLYLVSDLKEVSENEA